MQELITKDDDVPYSQETADRICLLIASSTKGIKRLCRENSDWPTPQNIFRWVFKHPHFRDQYARAKANQVELLAEEALEIAYDGSSDTYIDEKNNERCDHEWVARSRLKIDTIKWFASKLAPKIYGDRLIVDKPDPTVDPDLIKAKKIAANIKGEKNGRLDKSES